MKKFDYSSKQLIKTFTFTTATQCRETMTFVKYLGRNYSKFGVLQAVTFVGNLYKDDNGRKLLLVGISRQHPNDQKCDKELAYEIAYEKALIDPDIVMKTVPKFITKFNFRKMCEWYLDGMDLEMIKTKQEINAKV